MQRTEQKLVRFEKQVGEVAQGGRFETILSASYTRFAGDIMQNQ